MTGGAWINPDNSLALMAIVMVVVVVAMHLDTTAVARWFPAPVFALAAGFLLTNLGLVEQSGPMIAAAFDIIVPIAIPLLLFKANLRVVARGIGSMFAPFLLAYVATIVGTIASYLFVPLGPEGPAFAATSAAGLLGGSVNFVTVAQSEGLSSAGLALASATFIILQLPFIAFQQWMIAYPRRGPRPGEPAQTAIVRQAPVDAAPEPSALKIVSGVALAVVIAAAGKALAGAIGSPHLALPAITVLALLVANLLPRRMEAVQGDQSIGGILLLVYLTLVAMMADVRALQANAAGGFVFLSLVLSIHLAILLGVGRMLRLPLPQLLLASNATVGGPATAASLAQAARRPDLLAPAVLTGTLGYATATFVSLALANLLVHLA